MSDLENMTLYELKKLAKENNIRNISKLKKEELIEVLQSISKSTTNVIDEDYFEEIDEDNNIKTRYDYADDEVEEIKNKATESEVTYTVNNEEDEIIEGILEVLPDGYGFLRGKNYLSSPIVNPINKEEISASDIEIIISFNSDYTVNTVSVDGIDCSLE